MKFAGIIAMLLMGCAVFAGDIKINGEFKQVKDGAAVGWVQNKGEWAKPYGTVKLIQITEADGDVENALQVTSTEQRTDVYFGTNFPARAGEIYEIEAKVKGTGSIRLGFYVYDEKGGFIGNQSLVHKVSADFKEHKVKIDVKDVQPKEGDLKKAASIRFYFSSEANSDIIVKEIEVDKED